MFLIGEVRSVRLRGVKEKLKKYVIFESESDDNEIMMMVEVIEG